MHEKIRKVEKELKVLEKADIKRDKIVKKAKQIKKKMKRNVYD